MCTHCCTRSEKKSNIAEYNSTNMCTQKQKMAMVSLYKFVYSYSRTVKSNTLKETRGSEQVNIKNVYKISNIRIRL